MNNCEMVLRNDPKSDNNNRFSVAFMSSRKMSAFLNRCSTWSQTYVREISEGKWRGIGLLNPEVSICLSVCGTYVLRIVHLIGFTLGMCIVKGPRKCSVEFGAICRSDSSTLTLNEWHTGTETVTETSHTSTSTENMNAKATTLMQKWQLNCKSHTMETQPQWRRATADVDNETTSYVLWWSRCCLKLEACLFKV